MSAADAADSEGAAGADVVIVGASVGGLTVAQALRRRGFRGSLALIGAERELPYDRPPLSKEVLSGQWPAARTRLRERPELDGLDLDLRLGRPAVALDAARRRVTLRDGSTLRYGRLVVATGAHARRLPGQAELAGVHTLRTLDDSARLREDLRTARRTVVVGAGVLGCEIAATLRGLGLPVALLEPAQYPMERLLGPTIGGELARLHTEHGVRMLTSTPVTGLAGADGRVTGVRTASGEVVAGDVVVVAVGARPATDWLAGSGLTVDDGLVCDDRCRAADGVYAVGDVARFGASGGTAERGVRLENRTNATEQAMFVAADILGAAARYRPVPYFWSDQYRARIQVYGTVPARSSIRIVEGTLDSRRFVAHAEAAGQLVAVIGWNAPGRLRTARGLLHDTAGSGPAARVSRGP
ncbi:FAD-dependent oxidoreductase [Streptomyces kunmingensis]|uniref:FAD-dependent oxidoreductase n=1 Tax=Streptomyces kunmingensis TaxID=68225 RepID=A0ABU6CJF8_9ACTN|nr:FAD-dependent oxidoreductase [Streptomyces kunmingensis]MEB3964818.1 FAD-dependent oxidoreductase [Streptomyces kunmingensis]